MTAIDIKTYYPQQDADRNEGRRPCFKNGTMDTPIGADKCHVLQCVVNHLLQFKNFWQSNVRQIWQF